MSDEYGDYRYIKGRNLLYDMVKKRLEALEKEQEGIKSGMMSSDNNTGLRLTELEKKFIDPRWNIHKELEEVKEQIAKLQENQKNGAKQHLEFIKSINELKERVSNDFKISNLNFILHAETLIKFKEVLRELIEWFGNIYLSPDQKEELLEKLDSGGEKTFTVETGQKSIDGKTGAKSPSGSKLPEPEKIDYYDLMCKIIDIGDEWNHGPLEEEEAFKQIEVIIQRVRGATRKGRVK